MKRLLRLLGTTLVAFLLTSGVSVGTHGPATPAKRDTVSGTARVAETVIQVDAESAPSGTDPRGRFLDLLQAAGSVTCLRVAGNQAVIGGEVEDSQNPLIPEGSGIVIELVDNSRLGVGPDRVERHFTETPPTSCPAPSSSFAVDGGGFVVRDR
jgi:hypothetical protein